MDINKITLIGRLTKKPEEQRVLGARRASFTVATTCDWEEGKHKLRRTDLHRVFVSGTLASIALTYLEKSSRVYIEGRLTDRLVIADEIIMLGSPPRGKPKT